MSNYEVQNELCGDCDCPLCKPTPAPVTLKTKVKIKTKSYDLSPDATYSFFVREYRTYKSKFEDLNYETGCYETCAFYSKGTLKCVAKFRWNYERYCFNEYPYFPVDTTTQTEEQKEQEMTAQIEQNRIDHLVSRVSEVYTKKDRDAWTHFRLNNPSAPDTFPAIMDAFKKGDFYFSTDEDENKKFLDGKKKISPWFFSESIIWRNPKDKPDRDGYNKFLEALRAEKSKTLDAVKLLPAEKGLEALYAFEAKTFH